MTAHPPIVTSASAILGTFEDIHLLVLGARRREVLRNGTVEDCLV